MSYIKYYVYKKQQQVNGQWVDVYPSETKPDGNPLGTYDTLEECQGYVPPTPTGSTKFRATYSDTPSVYELECDGNTTLTTGNTHPDGYTYTAMTSAEIGSCVTTIGNNAFNHCSGLTSVMLPDSVIVIGEGSFSDCTGLSSITIPNSVTYLGDWAFAYCSGLTSVDIPNGVSYLGNASFENCINITSINIPTGVTAIGYQTFSQCTSLTSITIPNSVTSIGDSAISRCGFTSITIPNSVTTIGGFAFGECTSLTSVTIPSGVTSIGHGAFVGCTSLQSITCLAVTPPTLAPVNSWFDNTNNCPIYVPAGSVDTYKAASGWSDYSSRIQAIP